MDNESMNDPMKIKAQMTVADIAHLVSRYCAAESRRKDECRKFDEANKRILLRERRDEAYRMYLDKKSIILNNAWAIASKKLSDIVREKFKAELDNAWDEYDKVQKEIQSER